MTWMDGAYDRIGYSASSTEKGKKYTLPFSFLALSLSGFEPVAPFRAFSSVFTVNW